MKGTSFAQQTARLSRGSDDHVKWRSRLQKETFGDVKKVSPISTFLLKILTLQQSAFIIIIIFNAGFSVSDIHCLLNFLTLIMARLWLLTQAVISFNFG